MTTGDDSAEVRRSTRGGLRWLEAQPPWWLLTLGLLTFGAAGLGFAIIGGPVGVALIALLQAGAIVLLLQWGRWP